ncbi:glutathione S-transferase family protein [Roseovarius salinarum]|uniref:glutathione S-transferase family protein n=1 Tax=Roseovarius salinarum TaxID=1981892 RepID=UPI000C346100|nr:glutathione S-transferase family protein [Roseovarius salinarum]
MTTYRLHYAPDNASLIVRLALEELAAPYATVLVDRATRGHKAPDYLRLNPNGLIPVLETPDGPLFETGAILLWLADRHGALAPAPDSADRAGFLKWLFFTANTLHPALRLTFYPGQYVGEDAGAQTRLRAHMQGEIGHHLDKLEAVAGQAPGWFAAPAPTGLDIYVAPLLRWLALFPVGESGWFDLGRWPRLHAMAEALEARDSVAAAVAAEGLGPQPFTAPRHADPPEGTAT